MEHKGKGKGGLTSRALVVAIINVLNENEIFTFSGCHHSRSNNLVAHLENIVTIVNYDVRMSINVYSCPRLLTPWQKEQL